MKRIIVLALIAAFLVVVPVFNQLWAGDKVEVCHKPGTSAEKTIYVSESALKGHLGHGDTEGACASP